MRRGSLARLRTLLLAAAMAITGRAWAQCAPASCGGATPCACAAKSAFLGDLNNDGLVTSADQAFLESCIIPGGYCIDADLNFDGQVDVYDCQYLQRLVELSAPGGAPLVPKTYLSEIRTGKPVTQTDPAINENRYVEIRTGIVRTPLTNLPDPAPPANLAAHTLYANGWYYLKVCQSSGSGGEIQGTVAVVVDLAGMPVVDQILAPALGNEARNLSLVTDSSFNANQLGGLPAGTSALQKAVPNLLIPGGQTINGRTFPFEHSTNVTHLLVYRDPVTSSRAVPTVGQRVNDPTPGQICRIPCGLGFVTPETPGADCTPPGPLPPATDNLPPWDVIVDMATAVRGTSVVTFGCVFGDTPQNANSVGPIGTVGNQQQPLHPLRCRTLNTLVKGPEAIVFIPAAGGGQIAPDSDTPFRKNPVCNSDDITENCGELNPDGTRRNCFEPLTGPYCDDPDCCLNVCESDPTCCQQVWDQDCANLALQLCVSCTATTASCFVAHPTPSCSVVECCNEVCASPNFEYCCIVEWDADCVALARIECPACGSELTGPCDQVHDLPYCTDAACCQSVCTINVACCEVTWDAACVEIAASACGGCGALGTGPCCIVHPTPYCSNSACCAAVCDEDPFCCITSWDFTCTQRASIEPACEGLGCVCGFPSVPGAPFDCFVAHELPGCESPYCCQSVCLRDEYCCYVEWDQSCVRAANDLCASNPGCFNPDTTLPVNGSCYIPHLTPGCDTPGCCDQVCAAQDLSYCCDTLWDEDCVAAATDICDKCGDPFSGSCFAIHAAPNCADATCCNKVCSIDPFCCEGTWDGLCVSTAEVTCAPPIESCGETTRSCWIPNYLPGCSNANCCALICATIDPYCCEARWDAVCAREAGFLCEPFKDFPVVVGTEGCQSVHASPGCANPECTRAVCSVDPTCCETAWDIDCVLATFAVCPSPEACPSAGDCFEQHDSSGCKDPSCCNGVCAFDPTCCESAWDANCVSLAEQWCVVPADSDWICPCQGNCFEEHATPGCNDGACCAIVCNVNPVCCDDDWDADCVLLARDFCCGAPGCGSGCNGPCLVPHPEPFCSDPYCCAAVCQLDPLCCLSGWDALCVSGAVQRCASSCGMEDAGDCFVPRDLPGCKQGLCCAAVCALDPVCCQDSWDDICVGEAAKFPAECVKLTCGDPLAGDPCQPHASPASNNLACCEAVCAKDEYCCDTEWDATCVGIALGIPQCGCYYECGDTCAGDCCRAHDNQACDDAECCQRICQLDPYCCDTLWDSACAADARSICTAKDEACPVPPCGSDLLQSCCVASNAPNCNDESCCTAVCAVDPVCCSTVWDAICVDQAAAIPSCKCSGPACGDPAAGSCVRVHSDPFCDDADCCLFVCGFEPTCCSEGWDTPCVELAQLVCGTAPFADIVEGYSKALRGGAPATADAPRAPPHGWIPVRERLRMRKPLPPGLPLPAPRPNARPEAMDELRPGMAPAAPSQSAKGQAMPAPDQLAPAAPKKPGKG